jgi:hypothetical protein
MIRVAFQMKLKPAFEAEYQRRHDAHPATDCKEFAFAPAAPGTVRTRTGAGE